MTWVLAIDPGAKPGLCLGAVESPGGWFVSHDPSAIARSGADEVVIEDQHLASYIYKNGKRTRVSKKSQLTLVRTAERLLMSFDAPAKYRVLPDVWRRWLWPGAGRLTKTAVLARLRAEYGQYVEHIPAKNQPDCLEAIGIQAAWRTRSQAQKEEYRCV